MSDQRVLTLILIYSLGFTLFVGCKKEGKVVVARAGSIEITREDFANEMIRFPADYQTYLATQEGRKQLLDLLLRERILLERAKKSNIEKREEVRKILDEYEERMRLEEKSFRKNLILREFVRDLKDTELRITDPEIKLYYEENKEDFQKPRQVTASHILCATKEKAEVALKRVNRGEDFSRVAEELSVDSSARVGGRIGEISKGDYPDLPEFERTLFSMKSGKISGIVKTRMGYHIIKKTGEVSLPSLSFDAAAKEIYKLLEKKKFDEWIEKAKAEKKIWVNESELASISLQRDQRDEADSQTDTEISQGEK